MNSRYKDKLVGVYAPSSHGHTSVLGQAQAFSKWFWANKVKENYKLVRDMLEWLGRGNIDYLQLQQIEPEERMITISPKNFAKIDYYEAKETES